VVAKQKLSLARYRTESLQLVRDQYMTEIEYTDEVQLEASCYENRALLLHHPDAEKREAVMMKSGRQGQIDSVGRKCNK
jgi:hypothetical protein